MSRQRMAHCYKGHEYTIANTLIIKKTGDRKCKACARERSSVAADKHMFGGNREVAIIRDGEKCIKCEMTREQHKEKWGRDLTVDHIDGKGNGVSEELKNNSLDNLQTLCYPCHAAKDNTYKWLSDNDVANILHLKGSISSKEIAKMYGMSKGYVNQLHKRQWRKNVTELTSVAELSTEDSK